MSFYAQCTCDLIVQLRESCPTHGPSRKPIRVTQPQPKQESPAMTTEQIARAAHGAVREFLRSTGDETLPAWKALPAHIKDAYVMTVIGMVDDPDLTPEAAHRVWRLKQLQAGWNLGDVYDAMVQSNPDMLPYSMLPAERRTRDHVFHAVVRALVTE